MKIEFAKNFKFDFKSWNKEAKKEKKRKNFLKKKKGWFYLNSIKYMNLSYIDKSFKARIQRKVFRALRNIEYKKFRKFQKKLKFIYNVSDNGYLEYSDIYNHLLFLTTCMGIEYRNFAHTTEETVRDEVRSLWIFRKMLKDYEKIDDIFYNRQDFILKKKFGENTTLRMEFDDNDKKNSSSAILFKYINQKNGTQSEISSYHDAVTTDENIGIYASDKSKFDSSAKEKYRKEFFQYMMSYFYDHYMLWWD